MERKRNSTLKSNVKCWVCSAHDTNDLSLQNVHNNKLVPYASSKFLELKKNF